MPQLSWNGMGELSSLCILTCWDHKQLHFWVILNNEVHVYVKSASSSSSSPCFLAITRCLIVQSIDVLQLLYTQKCETLSESAGRGRVLTEHRIGPPLQRRPGRLQLRAHW